MNEHPLTITDSTGGNTRHAVGVHVVPIRDDGKILLGLRSHRVRLAPGKWSTVCGNLEQEDLPRGGAREAREETGIEIDPKDLKFAHLAHFQNDEGHGAAMAVFFLVREWSGVPTIREPDKCDALDWFDISVLPQPIVPYVALALGRIQRGLATDSLAAGFSLLGWPASAGSLPRPGKGTGG